MDMFMSCWAMIATIRWLIMGVICSWHWCITVIVTVILDTDHHREFSQTQIVVTATTKYELFLSYARSQRSIQVLKCCVSKTQDSEKHRNNNMFLLRTVKNVFLMFYICYFIISFMSISQCNYCLYYVKMFIIAITLGFSARANAACRRS
jgi:hypothetical protein